MVLSVKITGLSKVRSYLKRKNIEIERLLEKGVNDSGEFLKTEIKASISGQRPEKRSVNTGQFLNSIEANKGVVSSNVPQAAFMEYGSSKVPERRHFRNSADRSKHKIRDILGEALKKL